jgi:magnesium-transporting ATPase (P-type)
MFPTELQNVNYLLITTIAAIKEYAEEVTNVNFDDDSLAEHRDDPDHENSEYVNKVLSMLALCHTIMTQVKGGKIFYNVRLQLNIIKASSPDELALVNGGRYLGYAFKGRDDDDNMVVEVNGVEKQYKLLNVIEFTSTRKRMTIIVKDLETDEIKVLCKGADSIIIERLDLEK